MDPRLIQLMQHLQQSQQPVRFDDGGGVDDAYGSDVPIDWGGFDVPLTDYSNFGDIDWGNLFDAGSDLGGLSVDELVSNLGDEFLDQPGGNLSVDEVVSNLGDASGGVDLGSFEDIKAADEQAKLQELFGGAIQDLGAKGTLTDEGLLDISGYNQPGGFTSQWQTSGSDRIMVQDDGSAIGINTETGEQYSLNPSEVSQMVKNGQLNTFGSGYNTATGGNRIAPGGGKEVTTSDGKKVIVKPDGTVLDAKTLSTITNGSTIRDALTRAIGGGGTGTGSSSSNMSWLLPLLLMMMAMNRNQQPSGQAVIPKLSAERSTLPYGEAMRAPGYRPGQGGVQYVSDVQYKPMAAGGIAALAGGGKGLLHGPGDGVSDSIPATIGTDQPARLARGEYVVDARTVAELGNGSTDAGAERLDEMRQRVLSKRKQAKMGQDTKAYRHLPA